MVLKQTVSVRAMFVSLVLSFVVVMLASSLSSGIQSLGQGAEVEDVPEAPVDVWADMSPPQKRAARFIANTWRVGADHAAVVVKSVYQSAIRYNLDPIMLLAMAGKESSFRHIGNPDGGDDPMRPWGILQVSGYWHQEKFEDGVVRKTSVSENIDLGAQVVRQYLDIEHGDERHALMRYNGTRWQNDRYFRGVSKIKAKLQQAISDNSWDT